jgi:hypothetical protein
MQLELFIIFVTAIAVFTSWYWWTTIDRAELAGVRAIFFVGGLLMVSVAFLLYCGFVVENVRFQGSKIDFRPMLNWARPAFWVSIVALVLCSLGRGRSRVSGLLTSLLMVAIWVTPIWGM